MMVSEATDYTPTQQFGRAVYLREGCWYCHSQYVRPVTGETRRWGPVTEAGEYAYDVPHLFGTRRIGPDLMRVGLKYSDEWHLAHFWNPRQLLPDSIMAPYRGLFNTPAEPIQIVDDGTRQSHSPKTTRSPKSCSTCKQGADQAHAERRRAAIRAATGARQIPGHFDTKQRIHRSTVKIAAETKELEGLIGYLQKLGANRGKWRDVFEPQQLEVVDATLPRSEEWIAYGKEVYGRRCVGCHG